MWLKISASLALLAVTLGMASSMEAVVSHDSEIEVRRLSDDVHLSEGDLAAAEVAGLAELLLWYGPRIQDAQLRLDEEKFKQAVANGYPEEPLRGTPPKTKALSSIRSSLRSPASFAKNLRGAIPDIEKADPSHESLVPFYVSSDKSADYFRAQHLEAIRPGEQRRLFDFPITCSGCSGCGWRGCSDALAAKRILYAGA